MIIDHPPQDADLPPDAQRTAGIMARVRQVPAHGPAVVSRQATTRQAARQVARQAGTAPQPRRWWPALALLPVLAVTLLADAFGASSSSAPEVAAITVETGWSALFADALFAAIAALALALLLSRRSAP